MNKDIYMQRYANVFDHTVPAKAACCCWENEGPQIGRSLFRILSLAKMRQAVVEAAEQKRMEGLCIRLKK